MGSRIAIVGCGAVAHAHLPIVAECDRSDVTVLVDKAPGRAEELAAANDVGESLSDHRELAGKVDAAIVALPHHLHAPVAIDLLRSGIHVLVEKPMALTLAECDEMIRAAEENQRVLAVGLVSRWFGVARYVKRILDSGLLGPIRSFDVREGMIYSWPVASDFMFRRETGGGVLADTGAHVLDLLLWWLGDHARVDYRDDASGGVEADCELELELASGATGIVQMSRTRDLRNTWILRGEHGTLEVMRRFDASFRLALEGEGLELKGGFEHAGEAEDPLECFRLQWADFLGAIESGRQPSLSGAEGRRAVALIEACQAARKPLANDWETFSDVGG
jgi:predicted dehydrogenase